MVVWSNLAYIAAAGFLAARHPLVSAALAAVWLFSSAYHIYPSRINRRLDRSAVMGVVIAVLVELGLLPLVLSLPVLALAIYLAWTLKPLDAYISLGAGLAAGAAWPKSQPALLAFIAALACAYVAERHRKYYTLMHSLWHVLTALAIVLLFV